MREPLLSVFGTFGLLGKLLYYVASQTADCFKESYRHIRVRHRDSKLLLDGSGHPDGGRLFKLGALGERLLHFIPIGRQRGEKPELYRGVQSVHAQNDRLPGANFGTARDTAGCNVPTRLHT